MFALSNLARITFEFVAIMVLFAIYGALKFVVTAAWKAIKARRTPQLVEVKP